MHRVFACLIGLALAWGGAAHAVAAARPAAHPTVEAVAGRKAVTFDGRVNLVATFNAPPPITGNRPFTVAVWAYNPKISGEECLVQWARRGTTARCAQLNYGSAKNSGAVTHWSDANDMGYDGGVPAAGQWHYIAVTYQGGRNGLEQVWVDGAVNTSETKTLDLWPGDPVRLGSSEKGHWFSGSLASVQIYDYALTNRELAYLFTRTGLQPKRPLVDLNAAELTTGPLTSWLNRGSLGGGFGYLTAYGASPNDREVLDDLRATLRWTPGDHTVLQDVYFGTDKARIEQGRSDGPKGSAADSRAYKGRQPGGDSEYGPIPLQLGQTYYWRVDGVNTSGVAEWRGPVWSFTACTGQAGEPTPRNRVAAVPVGTDRLVWKPGKFAAGQTLYFGASREEVGSSLSPTLRDLPRDATSCRIPALPLAPGRTYYWRVDQINDNLPFAKGEVWSFRTADEYVRNDVTFFAVTDLHYGASDTVAAACRATVDNLNALPGTEYPAQLGGGVVRTPRGVVITGDMTNDGASKEGAEQWRAFAADFGVNGEGRLVYPVYEGGGNHDGGPRSLVGQAVKERNARRPGVRELSANGLSYSWDWDQVHCVQLNLYPGDERDEQGKLDGDWNDPGRSLEFLVADLKANVGGSGRPVILFQHYGWDGFSLGWGWWSEKETEAFHDAIKDYNVIGIVHGHSHATRAYQWKGIDVFNVGSGQADPNAGGFCVFHVTGNALTAAYRMGERWGTEFEKPIGEGSARKREARAETP